MGPCLAFTPFHLRPCVIAGETRPGDVSVVSQDGETVGPMYRVDGARTQTESGRTLRGGPLTGHRAAKRPKGGLGRSAGGASSHVRATAARAPADVARLFTKEMRAYFTEPNAIRSQHASSALSADILPHEIAS